MLTLKNFFNIFKYLLTKKKNKISFFVYTCLTSKCKISNLHAKFTIKCSFLHKFRFLKDCGIVALWLSLAFFKRCIFYHGLKSLFCVYGMSGISIFLYCESLNPFCTHLQMMRTLKMAQTDTKKKQCHCYYLYHYVKFRKDNVSIVLIPTEQWSLRPRLH